MITAVYVISGIGIGVVIGMLSNTFSELQHIKHMLKK